MNTIALWIGWTVIGLGAALMVLIVVAYLVDQIIKNLCETPEMVVEFCRWWVEQKRKRGK